jgi:hypothetical protein
MGVAPEDKEYMTLAASRAIPMQLGHLFWRQLGTDSGGHPRGRVSKSGGRIRIR